jgi:predicted enzyme related to lactoylglutathione lyase
MKGVPSHFEIGVSDTDRAQKFYGDLLGWTFETTPHGARIKTAGISGGMHRGEGEANLQIFYVVPDLDAAAEKVIELGGEVDEGQGQGPGGRWLYSCRDDQGVPFGLHEPPSGD